MKVSVNILGHNGNAQKTCAAFAKGIERSGDRAIIRTDRDYRMEDFDACVLWGYVTSCQTIIKSCTERRIPFVFLDLGYWRRELGYFKVAVNNRHPTNYVITAEMPDDRFKKLDLPIKPWRMASISGNVLLAGMSGKAAWSWGLEDESFERETIAMLRWHTKRDIIYRPKPSWINARSLPHSVMNRTTPISELLATAHCVVTHHSNVACEALLAGVPIFSKYGAAVPLGLSDITKVEHPFYPDNREQWAANLAYCQWTIAEMASGECWQHLKAAKLVR